MLGRIGLRVFTNVFHYAPSYIDIRYCKTCMVKKIRLVATRTIVSVQALQLLSVRSGHLHPPNLPSSRAILAED